MKSKQLSLATPEGIDEMIGLIKRDMEQIFAEDGHLQPIAFLVCRRDPRDGSLLDEPHPLMFPLIGDNDAERDAIAATLRTLAARADASAVVIAMEAWQKTPFGQRLGEILMCCVERDSDAPYSASVAHIVRDGDKATISPWSPVDMDGAGGRFGQILPRHARKPVDKNVN